MRYEVIRVDPSNGSGASCERIGEALRRSIERLATGTGVKILVAPGIYRESIGSFEFPGLAREAPLSIEADGGPVIVSGLDVVDPDSWEDCGDGLFRSPTEWSFGFGGDPWFPASDVIAHRCEMCFIDGEPLIPTALESWRLGGFWNVETPVDERVSMEAQYIGFSDPHRTLDPGKFGVTETPQNGRFLYLRTPNREKPSKVTVEITARGALLCLASKENVSFSGLTFRGAGTFPKSGYESTIRFSGTFKNVRLDNCHFEWNGAFGLNIGKIEGLSISDCSFRFNGYGGLGLGDINQLIIERTDLSCNDWRNYLGGCIDQSHCTAGVKVHNTHGALIRECSAVGNEINGMWFDVRCADVLVENCVCAFNRREGLFFEFSPGPFTARNNLLEGNGAHDYIVDVVGRSAAYDNILRNDGESSPGWGPSGGASIGQGMRYNEHADSSMEPGIEHRFERNQVCVGPKSNPAFAAYNRIRPEQTAAADLTAWSRFPASIKASGNRWETGGGHSFRYEDWRAGTVLETDSIDDLPIGEVSEIDPSNEGPRPTEVPKKLRSMERAHRIWLYRNGGEKG